MRAWCYQFDSDTGKPNAVLLLEALLELVRLRRGRKEAAEK